MIISRQSCSLNLCRIVGGTEKTIPQITQNSYEKNLRFSPPSHDLYHHLRYQQSGGLGTSFTPIPDGHQGGEKSSGVRFQGGDGDYLVQVVGCGANPWFEGEVW